MSFRLVAICALLTVVLGGACEDSGTTPPPPPDDPYQPLTTSTAVLQNIETAYNHRNATRYENVLDDGFTFFLSDGDVNNGLPAQWDRATEVSLTGNLFSRTQVGDLALVKSIAMDVQYESGVTWDEVTPPPVPGEVRYTATVFYLFQITVDPAGTDEDFTYYPYPNSKAQFTVRNAGTEDSPHWQLVEMRDLGAQVLALHTEQVTWGSVKALYR